MRDMPAPDSVQSSLFTERSQRQPEPERRTRPGRGAFSCKCERPEGVAFCHVCGQLIIPAELEP